MLRVQVVLPFYGGSLPIGRYCAEALRDIGCLVDVFETPDFFSAFKALQRTGVRAEQLEFLENSFLQVITQAICAKAETFQADLVLCMAQAPLSRQGLKRLNRAGITTAMWFVEDYRLFPYWRSFAPYYDVFAVIQKEPFARELEAIGVENALYLPLAALPATHKPLNLSAEEKQEYGADFSFLGAGYPNRRRAFARIARPGFKIWGTEWEGEPALEPYVQRNGARISSEDAVRVYNASTVNINLHSSVQEGAFIGNGDFVNPRTFELAASRAFQLVDQRTLLDDLFAPDELARFVSLEDLQEKTAFFLNHPAEREAYTERAYTRVIQEHQYSHRMEQLLAFTAGRISGFGARREPEALASLPQTYRQDFLTLLEEKKLPLTASFEDVALCIQGKKEPLSEFETAILFLWEWKRQYAGR